MSSSATFLDPVAVPLIVGEVDWAYHGRMERLLQK